MNMRHLLFLILALIALSGCGHRSSQDSVPEESRKAKQLLQGIWADEETEAVIFKMQGDSVFYPDTTSMTAYFRVVDDTLYIGSASYHIEKQTEHVLWFKGVDDEVVKLIKLASTEEEYARNVFEQSPAQVQTLTEVVKNDTVVFYDGHRYHLYIAINPTKYKVVRHTLNDDGLEVENVYYDNIVHLSIFQGSTQVFSKDFRKQMYQQQIASDFLDQAVLTNMEYGRTDTDGFHLNTSLCQPGDASCYLVENVISFKGQLSIQKVR